MNPSLFLALLNFLGIFGLIALIILIFFISPVSNSINTIIFLLVFMMTIYGSYSSLEYSIRKQFFKLSSPSINLKQASKNGFIVSTGIALMLFLQYLRVLAWWDAALLILIMVSISLYLRNK